MAIQSYTSPVDIKWNTDSQGNKVSIPITNEQHQVAQNCITLNQIPDYFYKVQIDGLYEIEDGTPDKMQFKVNYDMGIVTFDSSHEAEVVTINQYNGRGMWQTSAKRIYDDTNLNLTSTTQTLQDFINKVKEYQFENWNSAKIYKPNAIVYYHGSTFVCLKQTLNHEIPTNTEYWTPFATGTYWKGLYDGNSTYDLRDIVYYEPEQATYICIKQATVRTLPTNTTYWEKVFSVKEVSNYAKNQGDYALEQGDYAKQEGNTLAQIIADFTYIGEYDENVQYVPKNVVIYNGSTYINKITCKNISPTDTFYWQILASGFVYKGDYDNTKSYELRDMVYYKPEKTIYFCIKKSQGNLPINTEYWLKSLSIKSETDYATQQGDYAKNQGNYALEQGGYAKQEGDYSKLQGDYAKTQGNYASQATLNANTATSNYQDVVDKSKKIYMPSVATYNDILTTYPVPQIGWTVTAKDTHIEHRWDGVEWVDIGVSNAFQGYNVWVGAKPPNNTNLLWVYTTKVANGHMARIIPSKEQPIDKTQIWLKIT